MGDTGHPLLPPDGHAVHVLDGGGVVGVAGVVAVVISFVLEVGGAGVLAVMISLSIFTGIFSSIF